MKKCLPFLKVFTILVAFVLTGSIVNAQTRTASVSGNWNNIATWGGASVPTSANDVVINNGITVTVNVAAQCNSMTFGSTSGTVTVNSGITLDVTNGVTLQNSLTSNTAAALAGAGSINCASVVVGGTAAAITSNASTTLTSTISSLSISGNLSLTGVDNGTRDNDATLNLQSGSVSVAGSVALNEPVGSAVKFTLASGAQTGTLTLSGSTPFVITGSPLFTASGTNATVVYSGGAQTVRPVTYTYLVLAGSGVKTTTSVTVNTKLTMQESATAGNTITYSSAILEYNGNVAQTSSNNEFPSTMTSDVIINNAAGVTLNGAKANFTGDLTLTSGTLVAGNNLTFGTTGTPLIIRIDGNMTGAIQGSNDYSVTYTGSSKTAGPELSGSGLSTVTVNLNAGETLTLDQNRIPDGNLTVSAGTLDLSTFTMNRSSSGGTLSVSNSAFLKIGGTNSLPSNYNTVTLNTSSTVEYYGTAQTVGSATYANLILSGSGAKNFPGARTVNASLSMQGTATATGTSPGYGASAILEYKGSAAQSTSNVEFTGTGTNPVNVRIDNTIGVTLNAAKSINGALTLTMATLQQREQTFYY